MEELIVKTEKLKEDLVDLVNKSGLPAILLKPIFKEMYEQLEMLEQQQYKQAKKNVEEKNSKVKEEEDGQD